MEEGGERERRCSVTVFAKEFEHMKRNAIQRKPHEIYAVAQADRGRRFENVQFLGATHRDQ